jgi:3-hydroxy-3-methylglutaryl CoA synthase
MGEILKAEQLMDIFNPRQLYLDDEIGTSKRKVDDPLESELILSKYEKQYENFVKKQMNYEQKTKENPDLWKPLKTQNVYVKSLQRTLIEQFMKACAACKKCETCAAYSPGFRKDGNNKIFQKPFGKRQQTAMNQLKLKRKVSSSNVIFLNLVQFSLNCNFLSYFRLP